MNYRNYNPEKDKEAAHRIWLEVGWIEGDNYAPMDTLVEHSRTIVADINGQPECLVLSFLGDIDYLGERIPFSCIGGVTTSLIARKQKIAGRLTATRIALDAMEGSMVSGLGIFDQGYYDKFGYGTGGYEHIIRFSPSTLKIPSLNPQLMSQGGNTGTARVPIRLTKDDWKRTYHARVNRLRWHGSTTIHLPEQTKAEMEWLKNGFGLGYEDDSGELTHFMWMHGVGKENGPYHIEMLCYQTYDQLLELLGLLNSFGDQIRNISMVEPPGIQMQDFLDRPFLHRSITEGSKHQNMVKATAFWQMRICDLAGCLERTHLQGDPVSFNLVLDDPIRHYLDSDSKWQGISGEYVVTLGQESSVRREPSEPKKHSANLPTMHATVGAFTRMWLGCLPASSIAATGGLSADPDLLRNLDRLIRVPNPLPDWQF